MEQTLTHTKLTDGMREWTSEEVFTLEEQMRSLSEHPGWKALVEFIDAAREKAQARIEGAKPLEHTTYVQLGGFLAALRLVEQTPENVIAKAAKTRQELNEIAEEAERG